MTPLDAHLGARIRAKRTARRVSQAALATAVHLSHQQLQKYETGANRVSAATLYRIAQALETPVEWFYAGLPDGPPAPTLQIEVRAFLDYGGDRMAMQAELVQ